MDAAARFPFGVRFEPEPALGDGEPSFALALAGAGEVGTGAAEDSAAEAEAEADELFCFVSLSSEDLVAEEVDLPLRSGEAFEEEAEEGRSGLRGDRRRACEGCVAVSNAAPAPSPSASEVELELVVERGANDRRVCCLALVV